MAFNQRTNHPVSHLHDPRLTVRLEPHFPASGQKGRWAMCRHHADSLVRFLTTIRDALPPPVQVRIWIEDYAYGYARKRTNCLTKLAEDVGVVLTALYDAFGVEAVPVPIASIKTAWCGKGNATKRDMYHEYLRRGCPHIMSFVHNDIPDDNPTSDIVDAIALLSRQWDIYSAY